jgi:hypothetical protein
MAAICLWRVRVMWVPNSLVCSLTAGLVMRGMLPIFIRKPEHFLSDPPAGKTLAAAGAL